jgi:SAM-dependent methyltransferase
MTLSTLEPAENLETASPQPEGPFPISAVKLSPETRARLRCPACGETLEFERYEVRCINPTCDREYPISAGVPILVDEDKSVFSISGFLNQRPTFFKPVGRFRETISRYLPTLDLNITARQNYERLLTELKQRRSRSRVLVIGGGILGVGMETFVNDPAVEIIESDASIGERTQLICDAHDLPFADGSIDCVIVQAVLEHVLDPQRVVAEIHRVLGDRGLVYADTPQISQVHGREFDFTRFTYLGQRRLFRQFEEISSGITCGPGVALAWTLRYFLLSFFAWKPLRAIVSGVARVSFFWLKYFDYLLINKPAALDAAMATFLIAEKRDETLSDEALVASYRGGF